jgi:hypothetical protein
MNLKNIPNDNLLILTESLIKSASEFAAGFASRPFNVASKLVGQNSSTPWSKIISPHPYTTSIHTAAEKTGLFAHDAALAGGVGLGVKKLTDTPTEHVMSVDPNINTSTQFNPHFHDLQSTLLGTSIGSLGAYGAYKVLKGKRHATS